MVTYDSPSTKRIVLGRPGEAIDPGLPNLSSERRHIEFIIDRAFLFVLLVVAATLGAAAQAFPDLRRVSISVSGLWYENRCRTGVADKEAAVFSVGGRMAGAVSSETVATSRKAYFQVAFGNVVMNRCLDGFTDADRSCSTIAE